MLSRFEIWTSMREMREIIQHELLKKQDDANTKWISPTNIKNSLLAGFCLLFSYCVIMEGEKFLKGIEPDIMILPVALAFLFACPVELEGFRALSTLPSASNIKQFLDVMHENNYFKKINIHSSINSLLNEINQQHNYFVKNQTTPGFFALRVKPQNNSEVAIKQRQCCAIS